jgi:hypothetical protein
VMRALAKTVINWPFFSGGKNRRWRQNVQRVNAERIGCLTRISRPEKAVDGRLRQGGQAGGLNKMR